jgi:hypothetical protein
MNCVNKKKKKKVSNIFGLVLREERYMQILKDYNLIISIFWAKKNILHDNSTGKDLTNSISLQFS